MNFRDNLSNTSTEITGSIIYDYYSAYGVTLKKSDIKKVFKAAK